MYEVVVVVDHGMTAAGPSTPTPPPCLHLASNSQQLCTTIICAVSVLVYRPSHTLVRVGQYKKAVKANEEAYRFDMARGASCVVPYLPEHNVNMLIYAAR